LSEYFNQKRRFYYETNNETTVIVDGEQASSGSKNSGGILGTVFVPELTYDKNSANYVVNVNSLKFHYLNCSSVSDILDKNTAYSTADRNTLIANGFSPCGRCKP